jgi:hypothetical protein
MTELSAPAGSVAERVRTRIARMRSGEPFSVRELLELGPRASVDQALSRMTRGGEIERLARGLYARPLVNKRLHRSIPVEPEKVIEAVARVSGANIGIQGAEAARRFGLTTQVPMRQVVYTSGRSRKIQLRTGGVTLVHRAQSRMALAGAPAGEALSALLYLGKHEVTTETLNEIRAAIGEKEFARLRGAIATTAVPAWLADALYEAARVQLAPIG